MTSCSLTVDHCPSQLVRGRAVSQLLPIIVQEEGALQWIPYSITHPQRSQLPCWAGYLSWRRCFTVVFICAIIIMQYGLHVSVMLLQWTEAFLRPFEAFDGT